MIREDRNPTFWTAVYEHPAVKPHVGLGQEVDFASLVQHPGVTPIRAEHGGFLFVRLDGLGRVHELHTLFTPEGWGREALLALKAALVVMFDRGTDLVTTSEVGGNPRSQPPRSFRFAPAGDFYDAPEVGAQLRTWILTRPAWEGSPARQRMT